MNADGFAWGGGAALDIGKEVGVYAAVSYFGALGPVYSDNGLQYSHGYVGMKGQHAGGLMAGRFLGWHPSAYTDSFGVVDRPHDLERRSGTRVIGTRVEGRLPLGFHVGAGYWWFADTGFTTLDLASLDDIDPPFGYSRAEFEAEERLGRTLGHELSGNAGVKLLPQLDVFVQGGLLLPGEFYGIEVARVAGTALGHPDPQTFWNVAGGVEAKF